MDATSTTAHRAASKGSRAAERAAENPAVDRLGQLGMLARSVMVFTIAAIAVKIVLGGSGRAADSHGALQTLAGSPPGKMLLFLLAIAFGGHALWRLLEAAAGLHHDSGMRRHLKRIGFAAVGLLYAGLCVTTVRILAGAHVESENQTSHRATTDVLGVPGGRLITALIGAAIICVAAGVLIWAARGGFLKTLHLEHLGPRARDVVRWLGITGQVSRALVIGVAGWLFIDAALENNGAKAPGLDGTLRTIAGRSYGSALLLLVCTGLVTFGVFSAVQASLLRTSGEDRGAQ